MDTAFFSTLSGICGKYPLDKFVRIRTSFKDSTNSLSKYYFGGISFAFVNPDNNLKLNSKLQSLNSKYYMWKLYFKQAIQMLRQNSFISIISILGTAVAIMMIMAIIVSDEIKNIDLAPEMNRSRTLYITKA